MSLRVQEVAVLSLGLRLASLSLSSAWWFLSASKYIHEMKLYQADNYVGLDLFYEFILFMKSAAFGVWHIIT